MTCLRVVVSGAGACAPRPVGRGPGRE